MIIFRKLTPDVKMPKRATAGSAGFDLAFTGDSTVLREGEHAIFETSLGLTLPNDKVGIIKPRSGWAAKYGIDVLAGVIDSDYTGEIKVILINHGSQALHINTGDRIAQLLIMDTLPPSNIDLDDLKAKLRGASGFGSTGVN